MRFALVALTMAGVACGSSSVPDGGEDAAFDAPHDVGTDGPAADLASCADVDGDGHRDVACGGDDCDDADRTRYPGNMETCDATGRDEDCLPATLGPDGDGDGHTSEACCNRQPSGAMVCGDDCNDASPDIRPTAPEACNGVDDDCNGTIDDHVTDSWYPDCDHDGYGAMVTPITGCTMPAGPPTCTGALVGLWVAGGTDCDDGLDTRHPSASEACNGLDDDCDGTSDGVAADPDCATGAVHETSAMCTAGACAYACAAPFDDCTSAAGCETDLSVDDVSHCGDCSTSCHLACRSASCSEARSIAMSQATVCVVDTGENVECWGQNSAGVLGMVGPHATVPRIVVPGSPVANVVQIAVGTGGAFACARHSAGTLTCWGDGNQEQLGDGIRHSSVPPTLVAGLTDVTDVAAGSGATCVVRVGGVVTCFGGNGTGQLGSTSVGGTVSVPSDVPGATGATHVAVGHDATCAIYPGGQVKCWGSDAWGQLGDGATVAAAGTVVDVSGLADATQIAVGEQFACALHATGHVVCWGLNSNGKLGTGTTTNADAPSTDVVGLDDAVAIGAGQNVACAVRTGGGVRCWGANESGQLGDGTTTNRSTPVDVVGITDAVAVAPGSNGGCALRAGGAMSCWGDNGYGTLGNGTHTSSLVPVDVSPACPLGASSCP